MGFMMPLAAMAAVAGTATSVYGQYASGQAAQSEADYNAKIMRRQAAAVEEKTRSDQIMQQRRGQQVMGSMRAKLGASGARMDVGVGDMLQTEQAIELAYENALIGAEGRTRAEQMRSQGRGYQASGANAMAAGKLGAATSLLAGFGEMEDVGMFDSLGKKTKYKPQLYSPSSPLAY